MAEPLLDVQGLSVSVRSAGEWHQVISDVSFSVAPGEALALVGESGSGKSLIAMGAVNLLRTGSQVDEGKTYFEGRPMADLEDGDWRTLVGTGVGALFQDPIGAWDPLESIGAQSGEVLEEHYGLTQQEVQQRVLDALGEVKLPKQRKFLSFPHQISRGEAQRAMLASVLLSSPRILIADEPVTGLDVTVARAVLALVDDMRRERDMAMVLVTHDLGVVAGYADRVAVVYGGKIVEEGPVGEVFKSPKHPYTEGLLGSIPWPGATRLTAIPGDAPDIIYLPDGCTFAPRCIYVQDRCRLAMPEPEPIGPNEVRCYRATELELRGVTS